MIKSRFSRRFKKDLERVRRQGKNLAKLKLVMESLANEIALHPKHKDHSLVGNHAGRRECHIEPDWLLIYKVEDEELLFERTGSHSELFD